MTVNNLSTFPDTSVRAFDFSIMSHRSGDRSSGSDLDYEHEDQDDYDQHGGYYRNNDCSSESQEDRYDSDSEESQHEDEEQPVIEPDLNLCSSHKPGEMTNDCRSCAAALKLINDKAKIKLLTNGGQSGSGVVSRYSGRCDSVVPTLALSPDTIQIARDVFTKGQFKDRKAWVETLKNHLTLPADQHELLSADIKSEDVLNKFRHEKRFSHIFTFQKDFVNNLKNLRIAQRPILSLIEKTNKKIVDVKNIGVKVGVKFSDNPPVKSGGNVPRNGRILTDQLHVSDFGDILPRPDISDLIAKAKLSEEQTNFVVASMESYRASVGKSYIDLMESYTEYLSSTEDMLIFYSDLYSHCDGSLRELLRLKMASLFKRDVKTDIIHQSSHKKLDGKPSGLFGG